MRKANRLAESWAHDPEEPRWDDALRESLRQRLLLASLALRFKNKAERDDTPLQCNKEWKSPAEFARKIYHAELMHARRLKSGDRYRRGMANQC